MSLSSAEARLASLPPAPRQERVRASCYWRNTASAAARRWRACPARSVWLYAATDSRSAAPEKVVFGFADRFLEDGGIRSHPAQAIVRDHRFQFSGSDQVTPDVIEPHGLSVAE